MDDTIRVFSGRTFSPEDIELIKWTRKNYPKLSRHELASTVCEFLDWKTPAGKVKWHPCMAFFKKLEAEGVIQLPPVQATRSGTVKIIEIEFDTTEITGDLEDFEPIRLSIARPGEQQKRWRAYVDQYHMLGHKTVFGSRLQYFVITGDTELGCIQFSASAWALKDRDKWIGWNEEDKKSRLHLIVANSRFLIFPWVHIHNLASKVLSLASKQITDDWLREYCYSPVLLETFVDLSFFKGISYKASNWIYLGETKGRGRMDRNNEYALSKKAIFMYPLQKDFRAVLKGEKPCRFVNPDE